MSQKTQWHTFDSETTWTQNTHFESNNKNLCETRFTFGKRADTKWAMNVHDKVDQLPPIIFERISSLRLRGVTTFLILPCNFWENLSGTNQYQDRKKGYSNGSYGLYGWVSTSGAPKSYLVSYSKRTEILSFMGFHFGHILYLIRFRRGNYDSLLFLRCQQRIPMITQSP